MTLPMEGNLNCQIRLTQSRKIACLLVFRAVGNIACMTPHYFTSKQLTPRSLCGHSALGFSRTIMTPTSTIATRPTLSVSQLAALIRGVLEDSFTSVWVEGEVNGFKPMPSGHWYFTLKDQDATLKVAMFKGRNLYSKIAPVNGEMLRVRGRVTLYDARGELQMVAEQVEAAGSGQLQRVFEEAKARLQAEGLFDAERKRALPAFPRRVAVLTSPQGAAISDVLAVFARRYPLMHVEIWPSLVQGDEAIIQLRQRVAEIASVSGRYDVLLVTRGGGSAQDLACFNDEMLARQLAGFPIPVVAAVGHEIDFSLIDFVADVRAATPSAAAELIAPDRQRLQAQLAQSEGRIRRIVQGRLEQHQFRLEQRYRLLQACSPAAIISRNNARLAHAKLLLQRALQGRFAQLLQRLKNDAARLNSADPGPVLQRNRQRLTSVRVALEKAVNLILNDARRTLMQTDSQLRALSPERTLERGYAIVQDAASGQIYSRAAQISAPAALQLRMADGFIEAQASSAKRAL